VISLRSRDASRRTALATIRGVHSAIFAIELAAIGWLVYTGIVGRGDRTVGIAAGLVAGEGLVWLANDRVCPLTPLAERVGAVRGSVSDIWLPEPIARTIPQWSIPLVAAAIALHSRRILRAGATPRPSESERPR
jgi:hypothetical protein